MFKAIKITRTILEGNTYVRAISPPARAKWVVQRIQDMGPTYVKLGQFLSSRADIIDPVLINALKTLQDSSNPLPWSSVQDAISMDSFSWIDQTPIASASISQVHRGQLQDGTSVVVKIRRPGIVEDISNDIQLLEFLFETLNKYTQNKNSNSSKMNDTRRIVADLKRMIMNETDFMREVENMELMISKYPEIRIPQPYKALCNSNIIVMSYVSSIKLNTTSDAATRSILAYSLMDTFVQQFLQHGLIHGDPHEGNVAISSIDDSTLVMYDLGHVVQLDAKQRSLMKALVFEIMTENVDGVIDAMERMPEIITLRSDKAQVREFVVRYIEYVKTIDVKVLSAIDSQDQDLPLTFSSTIFEIVRIFGIVEGICVSLDPKFEYSQVFLKYVDTLVLDRDFLEYKAGKDLAKIWNWFA
jgi:predicted unusual protein kinase regulating ubiquinone biosynthesis (AarF/ABC1/UbiB family)